MDRPLDAVQREFADALLRMNAEEPLIASPAGEAEQNRSRLGLYRDNLERVWLEALSVAYPVLRALVGDGFFLTLSREYGLADPARSGDLNRFGSRMAELLESWPPSAPYPYLADVARLEWQVHRAYFARDTTPWPAQRWAQCAPEVIKASPIRIHPAVELLHTSTAAADLWLASLDSSEELESHDVERPQWMAVARPRWIPQVLVISPDAYAMLDDLRNGATLGAALDAGFMRNSNFDFAGNWRIWIEHGIVVSPMGRDSTTRSGDSQ